MSEPTIEEIAALTARLRRLSDDGRNADPGERARFLADKDELIARISAASRLTDPHPPPRRRADAQTAAAAAEALLEVARARAEAGGYVLVGPSAQTWRTDSLTGLPVEPVSRDEHYAVRELLQREQLKAGEPSWTDTAHGNDIVTAVIPAFDDPGLSGAEGPTLDAGPALTAEEATHELAADGYPLDDARALVRGYLDDVSEHVGTSAYLWGLDSADLDAIRAEERSRTAETVGHSHDAVAALPAAGCVVVEPTRDLDTDALADVALREQP